MKNIKTITKMSSKLLTMALLIGITMTSCTDDDAKMDDPVPGPDFSGSYMTADQMGRPAINTVFIDGARKDVFNTTVPSAQSAEFQSEMEAKLLALNPGYTTNALGWDAATFTGALSTDVLTVSTVGKTTFFDGTNVLTGRALEDDVISVELLLIFGGPDGSANPTLTNDNVDANDKDFLDGFPYLASPW